MKQNLTDIAVWLCQSRQFPYPRQMASTAMTVMYTVAGATLTLATVLPHPPTLNTRVLVVLGVSGCITARAIHRTRDRLPVAAHQWLMALGTVLTTITVATGGSTSTSVTFSFLYLWPVVYSLVFFSRLGTVVQVGLAGMAYVSVLVWQTTAETGGFTAVEPLVLVAVTSTTGIIVNMLVCTRDSGGSILSPRSRIVEAWTGTWTRRSRTPA